MQRADRDFGTPEGWADSMGFGSWMGRRRGGDAQRPCTDSIPTVEQLEPRLLLSADVIGIEPHLSLDVSPCEQIIQVDLQHPSEPAGQEDPSLMLTYLASSEGGPEAVAAEDPGREGERPAVDSLDVLNDASIEESAPNEAIVQAESGVEIAADSLESGALFQDQSACPIPVGRQDDIVSAAGATVQTRGPPAGFSDVLSAVSTVEYGEEGHRCAMAAVGNPPTGNGAAAPDLPGLRLIDPDISTWQGQIIYLDFDGERNVTYDGPVTIGPFDVPAFEAPGVLAGQEAQIMAAVAASLNDLFAGLGFIFTLDRPNGGQPYSTVYIGGHGFWASEYGLFYGLAEQVDVRNLDRADDALVFSDLLATGDLDTLATQLGETIAHEVGHLLGYGHIYCDPVHPASSLSAVAMEYAVNSLLDAVEADGQLTLREAIQAANANMAVGDAPAGSASEIDVTRFDTSLSGGTIVLNGTELAIEDDLVIQGLGSDSLTISAVGHSRVFSIAEGAEVEIQGLAISDGYCTGTTAKGAGIYNAGTLTLTDCVISGNSVITSSDSARGGGVYSSGTLTLNDCTLSDNSAAVSGRYNAGGGAVYNDSGVLRMIHCLVLRNSAATDTNYLAMGGGVYAEGTAILSDCTLSGNSALTGQSAGRGGAVYCNGDVYLVQCVLSGNRANSGGGAYDNGELVLTNCTVAGNSVMGWSAYGAGIGVRVYISYIDNRPILNNSIVALNSGGADVEENYAGCQALIGIDPEFVRNPNDGGDGWGDDPATPGVDESANDDYGDLHLKSTSAAIDLGNNDLALDAQGNVLTVDLEGRSRICGGGAVDLGAYEYQGVPNSTRESPSATVNTRADVVDAYDDLISLREAVFYAGATGVGSTIRFAASVAGEPIRLSEGEILLAESLTIDSSDVGGITIDAGEASRVFCVWSAVELIGLTLTGGHADRGGLIYNRGGTLILTRCTASDSSADLGAAIYSDEGTVTLTDSTLSGNSATYAGAIYSEWGSLELTGCIVSNNRGGGIFDDGGVVTLNHCTLQGNVGSAVSSSGWATDDDDNLVRLTVTDCVFSDNSAGTDNGGGLYCEGTGTLTRCVFQGNSAKYGGAVSADGELKLIDCTLSGNSATFGGGLYVGGSGFTEVALIRCTLSGNSAQDRGGGFECSGGRLTLTQCTLEGNWAGQGGGAYLRSSSSSIDTEVILTNCVLVGNSATGSNAYGGGICAQTTGDNVVLTLTNSTLTGNAASGSSAKGSGLYNAGGTLVMNNTIVALNTGAANLVDVEETWSGTQNLIGIDPQFVQDPSDGGDGWADDPATADIDENANNDYGDLHPSPVSVAIDLGNNDWAVDADGIILTSDLGGAPRVSHGTVDVGAYEYQGAPDASREVFSTRVSTLSDGELNHLDGVISLRDALLYAGATGVGTTVTFDDSLAGGTIRLSRGQVELREAITIDASGVGGITIDARGGGRVLYTAGDVRLTWLTITGGLTDLNGGGIYNDGTLTLMACTVSDNKAGVVSAASSSVFGGGIYSRGELILVDCVLAGNLANRIGGDSYGGAIYHDSGTLTLTRCILWGNTADAGYRQGVNTGAYGGGIYARVGVVTLTDCTVSKNICATDEYGHGAGIYNSAATVKLTNCTFSGNQSLGTSAAHGGGIYHCGSAAKAVLTNVTICGNTASFDGGGIYGTVTLCNSVVVMNTAGRDGNDIQGEVTDGGHNLLGGDPQWTLILGANGYPVGYRPNPGSPLVDGGDSSLAVDSDGNPLLMDQRGLDRIAGTAVDIGAMELQDEPELWLVTPPEQTLVEGKHQEFQLRLTSRPSGPVAVDARWLSGSAGFSAGGVPLTFDESNWADVQSFTISLSEDADREDTRRAVFVIDSAAAGFLCVGLSEIDNDWPDLVVTDIVLPAEVLLTGKEMTVSWTVENQGGMAATGMWWDRLYLSDDWTIDADDWLALAESVQATLEPGESYTRSFKVTVPDSLTGLKWLIGRTDATGLIDEHDLLETNNTMVSSEQVDVYRRPLPNLVVSSVTPPSGVYDGHTTTVSWIARNTGDGPTDKPLWYDYVYLSRDDKLDAGDHFLGQKSNASYLQAAGGLDSYSNSLDVIIPQGWIGDFYILVKADGRNDVYEFNVDGDNVKASAAFHVETSPHPDLQVQDIVLSNTTPFSGTSIVVMYEVRNVPGPQPAERAAAHRQWTDTLVLMNSDTGQRWTLGTHVETYLSPDTVYLVASGSELVTLDEPDRRYLQPGDVLECTLSCKIPVGVFGDNFVVEIRTDANDEAYEGALEGNNSASVSLAIRLTPPPDLETIRVVVPAEVRSGTNLSAAFTIANNGASGTLSSSWKNTVYLSRDRQWNAQEDILLGTCTSDMTRALLGEQGSDVSTLGVGDSQLLTCGDILLSLPPNDHSGSKDHERTWSAAFGTEQTWSGEYYVIVVANSSHGEFELDYENNVGVSAGPVKLVPKLADLVVGNVQTLGISPGEAVPSGSAVRLQWTVMNSGQGDTLSTHWNDAVYLSTDGSFGGDIELPCQDVTIRPGDNYLVSGESLDGGIQPAAGQSSGYFLNGEWAPMLPGGFYTRTLTVVLPADLQDGDYTLFVQTDSGKQILELDEGNNVSGAALRVTRRLADLVVSDVSLLGQTTALSGGTITVRWTERNAGAGEPSRLSWSTQIHLSSSTDLSGWHQSLQTVTQGEPRAAGASRSFSRSFKLPEEIAGDYYILVMTDAGSQVIELNESNNTAVSSGTLHIDLKPVVDLKVVSVAAPDVASAGQTVTLGWTLRNDGGIDLTGGWEDHFYLSLDKFLDLKDDRYLGSATCKETLATGQTLSRTAPVELPMDIGGPFWIFVVTDGRNQVFERAGEGLAIGENVNLDPEYIFVNYLPPTNLVAGTITVPPSAVPGQRMSITYTVENAADGAAAGYWYDSLYISADGQWDIGDVLFDRIRIEGPLAGHASYTRTIEAPMPGVLPGEDYHVIVRTDIRNHIPESDESDNLRASLDGFEVIVEELPLGSPVTPTLAAGQSIYYRIEVPQSDVPQGIVVALRQAEGASEYAVNELYLRYGQMPTTGEFDAMFDRPAEANQQIVLSNVEAGTYYVLARCTAASNDVVLSADLVQFSVFDVAYGTGGTAGNYTIKINGVMFDRTVTAKLSDGAGFDSEAIQYYRTDAETLYATFDLTQVQPGTYDVIFTKPTTNETATVDDGLTVVAGGGGTNTPYLANIPEAIQRWSHEPWAWYSFNVCWQNTGINDIAAPLIQLQLNEPFSDNRQDLLDGTGYYDLTFYGVGEGGGPAGILRPGQAGMRTFHLKPEWLPDNERRSIVYGLESLYASGGNPMDWNAIRGQIRPPDLTDEEFTPILEQLRMLVGPTNADFLAMLSRNATVMADTAGTSLDWNDLVRLEINRILAETMPSITGRLACSEFGAALGGMMVEAVHVSTGNIFSTYSLQDGSFVLHSLAEGRYALSVPGGVQSQPIVVEVPGAGQDIVIELAAGVDLTVHVYEAQTGETFVGAAVEVRWANGTRYATTDHLGRATLRNCVMTEDMGVLVYSTGYAPALLVGLTSDEVSDLSVSLSQESMIGGRLILPYNANPDDILVWATLEMGQQAVVTSVPSVLDTEGCFELHGVGCGSWSVYCEWGHRTLLLADAVQISEVAHVSLGSLDLAGIAEMQASIHATDFASAADFDLFVLSIQSLLLADGAYLSLNMFDRYFAPGYSGTHGLPLPPKTWIGGFNKEYLDEVKRLGTSVAGPIADIIAEGVQQDLIWRKIFDCWEEEEQTYGAEEAFRRGGGTGSMTLDCIACYDKKYEMDPSYKEGKYITGGCGYMGSGATPETRKFEWREVKASLDRCSDTVKIEIPIVITIQDAVDFWPDANLLGGLLYLLSRLERLGWTTEIQHTERVELTLEREFPIKRRQDCPCNPALIGDPCHDPDIWNAIKKCREIHGCPTPATPDCGPYDPNDIIGPAGFGDEHWVSRQVPLDYRIRFENDSQVSSVPAKYVRITQTLDSDLDWRTFRLGSFGFGDFFVDVPANRSFYETRIDCRETLGVFVDFTAGVDVLTGEVFWELDAIDPATGQRPSDPRVGFLPPNTEGGIGEGFVTYRVNARATAWTGDRIDARATIWFDGNPPMDTPAIFNTIDAGTPQTAMGALPDTTEGTTTTVSWGGTDDEQPIVPSGDGLLVPMDGDDVEEMGTSRLRSYDIYVSMDGGPWELWLEHTELTSAPFSGLAGHTYSFCAVARDNAGNRGLLPGAPQTSTTLGIVGHVPQARNDSYSTAEGTELVVDADSGLLHNDSDQDGDPLTIHVTRQPRYGQLTVNGDGSFTYQPAPDYNGPDSFAYRIDDGNGNSAVALVELAISADAVAPAAPADLVLSDSTVVDGVLFVRTLTPTLTGVLSGPGQTVEIYDETLGRSLALTVVAGDDFAISLDFDEAGVAQRRLMVRATDCAGLTSEAAIAFVLDMATPRVVEIATQAQLAQAGVQIGSLTVRFSKPMVLADLITEGSIVTAVTIFRISGTPPEAVILRADQFSYDPDLCTLTITLDAGQVLPTQTYELRLDIDVVLDITGKQLIDTSIPVLVDSGLLQAGGSDPQATAYSAPAWADWNGDGVMDMLVGEQTADGGKIRVYVNSGSNASPVFTSFSYVQSSGSDLIVSSTGCLGASPRMVDWNHDGLLDLVVGRADGTIQLFINVGTAQTPSFAAGACVQMGTAGSETNVDVGDRATVEIADWNNDGLFDLVVGALDGRVRVYLNGGSEGSPHFVAVAIIQEAGADLIVPSGRSSPTVFDLNGDGRKDLVCGNTDGQIVFYASAGTDESPQFTDHVLLQSGGQTIDLDGTPRSRLAVSDLDNDGLAEIFVGASDGRLRVFEVTAMPESLTASVLVANASEIAERTFQFAARPADATAVYLWDFDDASEPVSGEGMSNTDHEYGAGGVYTLSVSTAGGDGIVLTAAIDLTAEGQTTGTIGDLVWLDVNANGVRDDGEVGLAGVTVTLFSGDGTELGSLTTGSDGSYHFGDLSISQNYYLEFLTPTGYALTAADQGTNDTGDSDPAIATGRTVIFTIIGGGNLHWDAGVVALGCIGGVLWNDLDGDGRKDDGEPTLNGWTVYIDANGSGGFEEGQDPSCTTGADGQYLFENLRPGSYVIREVVVEGWVQTYPGSSGAAGINSHLVQDAAYGYTGSSVEIFLPGESVAVPQVQASLGLIRLDAFHADPRFAGIRGQGYSVVVIDTGIDVDHSFFGPDTNGDGIADRIVYQYDFADNDADATDISGHGSHVTSTIASSDAAYGGVAPEVGIIHLKVFKDDGRGYFSYAERALQWVIQNAAAYNVVAMNMSFGDGSNWQQEAGRYGIGDELAILAAMGIITVSAAGNGFGVFDSVPGLAYPAADPSVLSVGAVWDSDRGGPWSFSGSGTDYTTGPDRIASFSQRGEDLLDVLAPGALIGGANAQGGVSTMRGTSMAAPFVTGAAILAQQIAFQQLGRLLTPREFAYLLQDSGALIIDGDDEDDSVVNTRLAFSRLDMVALAEAILTFDSSSIPDEGDASTDDDEGSAGPLDAIPFAHSIELAPGQTRCDADFGNRPPNTAPVVDAGMDIELSEGRALAYVGSFTDADAWDSWTATVDYGDGAGPHALVLTGATFGLNHTYLTDGIYTITVAIADEQGAVGEDSLTVTVGDLSPTAALTGDTSLEEGQSGSFDASASASFPDAIVSYEWDWDYDGVTFDPSGDAGMIQTHTWTDGGTHAVGVRVTDEDGSMDIASLVVTVRDAQPPVVSVDSLLTNSPAPRLTGTINDPTASVRVTVAGTTYTAVNQGDGTWLLAEGAISPRLADGTYDVTAVATDVGGNAGSDQTTDELKIDTLAPAVPTVIGIADDSGTDGDGVTNDRTLVIQGSAESGNTVEVCVDGVFVGTTTTDSSGNWTFDCTGTSLADGTYDFTAKAVDAAGNASAESTVLTVAVDTAAPVVTVNSLTTTDTTPQMTGTLNDPWATVAVTINGRTYAAVNNGNGTWTLANDAISPALAAGAYEVVATATDLAGNVGEDGTLNELTIQAAPAVPVSVDHLLQVSLGSTRHDLRTRRTNVQMTIKNTSATAIQGPVWIVIKAISDPGVTLVGSSGKTVDGYLYIDVTSLLGDGRLDPGESISTWLAFSNPLRRRFDFTYSIRGRLVPVI